MRTGSSYGRFVALALVVASALSATSAGAQSRDSRFGIGVMVGEPTGLSMKLRATQGFAIDFGVGAGAFGPGRLQVHADFLGTIPLAELRRTGMGLYFGAGPRLAFFGSNRGRWTDPNDGSSGDLWVGVRGALGLVWEFNRRHLDLFIEAAPTVWILEGLYFDSGGAIGARFWL